MESIELTEEQALIWETLLLANKAAAADIDSLQSEIDRLENELDARVKLVQEKRGRFAERNSRALDAIGSAHGVDLPHRVGAKRSKEGVTIIVWEGEEKPEVVEPPAEPPKPEDPPEPVDETEEDVSGQAA